jgi:hypothetical protein
MNFPAGSESYLNTRACGKTAIYPDFMRLFSIMEPEKPRKTLGFRLEQVESLQKSASGVRLRASGKPCGSLGTGNLRPDA